jgi:hypothetical protein
MSDPTAEDDLSVSDEDAEQLLAAAVDEDDTEDTDTGAERHSEAARYRHRLRAAESELEATRERLAALQKSEVERLAGAVLASGSDLWLAGAQLGGLLDEAGHVDQDKVNEAAKGALADRPHWAPRPKGPLLPGKPKASLRGGGDPDDPSAGGSTGWTTVLGR